MTTADQPNRDALTAALDAYGDAMREFIARVLSAEHGENPLERFLGPRTHLADVVAGALSDSDRDAFLERIQSGAAVEDAIEVAAYPSIVESQWGLFRQHLSDDRGVITRMRRIAEVHAAVEDPLTGDLAEPDVAATMTEIADLLELIGEHDQANEIRAQLRALAPREAARSQQNDANGDPETDQRPEDQPTELDPEPAQNAGQEELDEIRLSHMVLRHDLATLESARGRLEADIADLKQAQQDTAAHVATQGNIIREATSSLAELQQASRDPQVGAQSLASGRGGRIVEIPLVGAALFVIVGVILAASLQGIGIVDLTTLPPQLGSPAETVADLQRAQEDTAALVLEQGQTLRRGLDEISRVESSLFELQEASGSDDVNEGDTSATPTGPPAGSGSSTAPASATTPTPADPEPAASTFMSLLASVEPESAVILNTGPDGMSPGGEGVPHYRDCLFDDHFWVSDTRWRDGTTATVRERGTRECFSWLKVEIGSETTWVREEYVFVRLDNESGMYVVDAPHKERYYENTDVRLAVFFDTEGNMHWLLIEYWIKAEYDYYHRHPTQSRGRYAFGERPHFNGKELGFSWVWMDDYGKIVGQGSVDPGEESYAPSAYVDVITARLWWFEERGIAIGSYVEIFDLPVRISADGTLSNFP